MHRYRRCLFWLLTAAIALGLAGCSSAPPLPALSPNRKVIPVEKDWDSAQIPAALLSFTKLDEETARRLMWDLDWVSADPRRGVMLLEELGGQGLLRGLTLASTTSTELPATLKTVFRVSQSSYTPELAREFATQLVEALEVDDEVQRANNAAVLSYLLRDVPLHPELALTLGPKLLEKDQGLTAEGKNWSTITSSVSDSVTTLFSTTDWRASSDVFTSYLSGLALDGSTALTFLTNTPDHTTVTNTARRRDGDPDQTGIARQQYLLQQRDWNTDQYTTITAVFRAAATSEATTGTAQAAGVVSSLVEMLANRSHNTDSKGNPLHLPASLILQRGTLSDQASTNILHTLEPYLTSVGHYYTPDTIWPTANDNDPAVSRAGTSVTLDLPWYHNTKRMAVFTRKNLQAVILAATATHSQQTLLREMLTQHRVATFTDITQRHRTSSNFPDLINQAALNDAALEALYTTTATHNTGYDEDREREFYLLTLPHLCNTLRTTGAIPPQHITQKVTQAIGSSITPEEAALFNNNSFPTYDQITTKGMVYVIEAIISPYVNTLTYRQAYEKALNT